MMGDRPARRGPGLGTMQRWATGRSRRGQLSASQLSPDDRRSAGRAAEVEAATPRRRPAPRPSKRGYALWAASPSTSHYGSDARVGYAI